MGAKPVESMMIMDEHLKDIEKKVNGTLERFQAAGVEIDQDFIDYLEDKTVDRVNKACDAFKSVASKTAMKRKSENGGASSANKKQKQNERSESSEGDSSSEAESVADSETKKPSKLGKFLSISGIPEQYLANEDNLRSIFRSLCEKLELTLLHEDIEKIYQNGNELIVKFERPELRDLVLESAQNTLISSKEVCELDANERPTKITIQARVIPGLT